MGKNVDLHVHSSYSDGIYRPAEIVAMAAEKNLRAIALADHDSVDGIDEALAAGLTTGIEVIPAVEFSVAYNDYQDVHLLGYFLDHHDAGLQAMLQEFRTRRDTRGEAIIEAINRKLTSENRELISYQEAMALADGALGRPHIARVLIGKKLAQDMQDAFARYLIPCDIPKQYFAMADALTEIKRLRGVAILAHPTSISTDFLTLRKVIGELVNMGLDGLEVVNNMSNREESHFLSGVANMLGLVVTGGSDFHGIETGIELGRCSNRTAVHYRCVEALRELHQKRGGTT